VQHWLTVRDVARLVGFTVEEVRAAIEAGKLRRERVKSRLWLSAGADWLAAAPTVFHAN
jgi:hypothetical protein